MKPANLLNAINEAKRFLAAAAKVEGHKWTDIYGKKHEALKNGRECAALRRASMDLTNALADLRRR